MKMTPLMRSILRFRTTSFYLPRCRLRTSQHTLLRMTRRRAHPFLPMVMNVFFLSIRDVPKMTSLSFNSNSTSFSNTRQSWTAISVHVPLRKIGISPRIWLPCWVSVSRVTLSTHSSITLPSIIKELKIFIICLRLNSHRVKQPPKILKLQCYRVLLPKTNRWKASPNDFAICIR